jgi:hypothetical protein
MYRSIFVGSRQPLALPTLASTVPMQQEPWRAA